MKIGQIKTCPRNKFTVIFDLELTKRQSRHGADDCNGY